MLCNLKPTLWDLFSGRLWLIFSTDDSFQWFPRRRMDTKIPKCTSEVVAITFNSIMCPLTLIFNVDYCFVFICTVLSQKKTSHLLISVTKKSVLQEIRREDENKSCKRRFIRFCHHPNVISWMAIFVACPRLLFIWENFGFP